MSGKHSVEEYDRLKVVGLGVGLPLGLLALAGLLIVCCICCRKRRRRGRAAVRLEDVLKSPGRRAEPAGWDADEEAERPAGDVPLGAVAVAAEGERAASPDLEAGGHRRLSFERREADRRVDVEHSPARASTDDDDLPPAPPTLLPTWRASLPSSSSSSSHAPGPGTAATTVVPGVDEHMAGGGEERRNVTMILGGGGLAAAQAATVLDELPPSTLLHTWRASVPSASGSRTPGTAAATVPGVDEHMDAEIVPGGGEERMNEPVILGGEGVDDELAPPTPPPRPLPRAPLYPYVVPEHDEDLWGPPGERIIPPSPPPASSSSSSSSPATCSCIDNLFGYVFAAE